jgi:hypothetical protein
VVAKRSSRVAWRMAAILAVVLLVGVGLLGGYGIHTKRVQVESVPIRWWRRIPYWGPWRGRIRHVEVDRHGAIGFWAEGQRIGMGPLTLAVWGRRTAGSPPEKPREPGKGVFDQ